MWVARIWPHANRNNLSTTNNEQHEHPPPPSPFFYNNYFFRHPIMFSAPPAAAPQFNCTDRQTMAAAALLNIYAQTLDEAIASSSSDDFVQGFNLPGDHHDLLSRTYAQATTLLQSNALVRSAVGPSSIPAEPARGVHQASKPSRCHV